MEIEMVVGADGTKDAGVEKSSNAGGERSYRRVGEHDARGGSGRLEEDKAECGIYCKLSDGGLVGGECRRGITLNSTGFRHVPVHPSSNLNHYHHLPYSHCYVSQEVVTISMEQIIVTTLSLSEHVAVRCSWLYLQ